MTGIVETGGTVAVAIGLVEVIKMLVTKIQNGRNGNHNHKSVLSDDEKHQLKTLFEVMLKSDSDGVPLCFTPRRLIELQETTNELIQKQTGIIKQLLDREVR